MEKQAYLQNLLQKLRFYMGYEKLLSILKDFGGLWDDHAQAGASPGEILTELGEPDDLLADSKREGSTRFWGNCILFGGLLLVLFWRLFVRGILGRYGFDGYESLLPSFFVLASACAFFLLGGRTLFLLKAPDELRAKRIAAILHIMIFCIAAAVAGVTFYLVYLSLVQEVVLPREVGPFLSILIQCSTAILLVGCVFFFRKAMREGAVWLRLILHALGAVFVNFCIASELWNMDLRLPPDMAYRLLCRDSIAYYLAGWAAVLIALLWERRCLRKAGL